VTLVFIYGLPATGKLTVAQELERMTGYKLFHNHLAVDLLLSVFEFGSESFVRLREEIWLSVFEQACRDCLPGLIFTFAPEATVRASFVGDVLQTVLKAGGQVRFFELTCPLPELKQRIESLSRREFGKLASVRVFEQLLSDGAFDPFPMPPPELTIDTSQCTPPEAAARIARQLELTVR